MAYIQQRGDFWRAEVKRKGYKPQYASFDTKRQADQWSRQIEAQMDTGSFSDNGKARRMTLAQALEKYRDEIVPKKSHPYQENRRIERWLRHDLAYRTLANLDSSDFAQYRDARRAEGRKENTIRLELSLIRRLFTIARKEWKMPGLPNPFNNVEMPSGSEERERRLSRKEHVMCRRRLRQSRNPYAIHAFDLAIETSLRQGTLFRLRWEWVDFPKLRITLPASERTKKTRAFPLSFPCRRRRWRYCESFRRCTGRRMASIQTARF